MITEVFVIIAILTNVKQNLTGAVLVCEYLPDNWGRLHKYPEVLVPLLSWQMYSGIQKKNQPPPKKNQTENKETDGISSSLHQNKGSVSCFPFGTRCAMTYNTSLVCTIAPNCIFFLLACLFFFFI